MTKKNNLPDGFAEGLARSLDNCRPDYPEALIRLIDALRDYIWIDTRIASDLLNEGAITREQHDKGMIETKQMMMLLRGLENHGIDPGLHGTIKEK